MYRQVDLKALISHIVKGDGLDRCRICMGDTSEGQVYLSDTVMTDGEKKITLADLLAMVTGTQFAEEYLCPNGVCSSCTSTAIAAYDFSLLVRNSNSQWVKASQLVDTITSVDRNVKACCIILDKNTLEINNILNDYQGGNLKVLANRLIHRVNKKRVVYKKRNLPRSGQPCRCQDCGKTFPTTNLLQVHLKNSGQKECCLYCGDIVTKGTGLKKHMLDVHKKEMFLCSNCPLLFPVEKELKRHKRIAHKPGALTCGDCGRTFPRRGTFEAHSQMHAVRTCRACGAQFSNRGCYREHRSQCEPDAKPELHTLSRSKRSNIRDPATFICDYCNKVYNSRPQLKNHIMWIHMDVRPHQCQWCGKRFYTASRLTEHSVVHTRVRNFSCDICGIKLVSKMAAVYHKRRHTGEKPYKCEDCGMEFICSSRRSEHAKRRHGKGERFLCTLCPSSFVRRFELRKHIEKAHKNGIKKQSWNVPIFGNTIIV